MSKAIGVWHVHQIYIYSLTYFIVVTRSSPSSFVSSISASSFEEENLILSPGFQSGSCCKEATSESRRKCLNSLFCFKKILSLIKSIDLVNYFCSASPYLG